MSELEVKDFRTYSVYGLLAAGSRFTDDYSENDAIEHYLELHPDADRAAVEQELRDEVQRRGG